MRRHHLWLLTAPLHIDPPSDENLTQSQTPGGLEWGELFDKTITLAKAVGSLVGPYAGPMAGLAATLEVLRDFNKGVAGLRGEIYRVIVFVQLILVVVQRHAAVKSWQGEHVHYERLVKIETSCHSLLERLTDLSKKKYGRLMVGQKTFIAEISRRLTVLQHLYDSIRDDGSLTGQEVMVDLVRARLPQLAREVAEIRLQNEQLLAGQTEIRALIRALERTGVPLHRWLSATESYKTDIERDLALLNSLGRGSLDLSCYAQEAMVDYGYRRDGRYWVRGPAILYDLMHFVERLEVDASLLRSLLLFQSGGDGPEDEKSGPSDTSRGTAETTSSQISPITPPDSPISSPVQSQIKPDVAVD